MNLKTIECLTIVIVLSVFELSLACKNSSRQRRDGDWASKAQEGIIAGAGMAMEMAQQGAGMKNDFNVKIGDNEMGNKFGTGTGEAFKSINGGGGGDTDESERRRKRSAQPLIRSMELINSAPLKSLFRQKRQSGMNPDQMQSPTLGQSNESVFDRMKQVFGRIMDMTKDMFQKMRESVARNQNGQNGQNGQQSSNVERFQ